jgi:hypothetical protein
MKINFSMWKTALTTLVKMEDKHEWDGLDVVSKWLIATRSAVTVVTVYSSVIAGLLAWREGYFSWLPWLIVTLGLFIAHGANNLLNDYTDFTTPWCRRSGQRSNKSAGSLSVVPWLRWQVSTLCSTQNSPLM